MANIRQLIGFCPQVPTNLPFCLRKRVGSLFSLIHLWPFLCSLMSCLLIHLLTLMFNYKELGLRLVF